MSQKDVSIVIAAIDQASAILEDVGKSSDRLVGKMDHLASQSEETSQRFEFSFKQIALAAGSFVAVEKIISAATAAITSSISIAWEAAKAYDAYTIATIGLDDSQKQLAKTLQDLTLVDDAEIALLMKQAETLGINTDRMEEMTVAALGLAKTTGDDLAATMRDLVAYIHGDTTAFDELIPRLKDVQDTEQRTAIILEEVNKGWQQHQQEILSGAKATEQMDLALGDLEVQLGAIVAPAKNMVAALATSFLHGVQKEFLPASNAVNQALMGNEAVMESLRRQAIVMAVSVETTLANMGTSVEMVFNDIILTAEGLRADLAHTFTTTIPLYGEWFSENFPVLIEAGAKNAILAVAKMTITIDEMLGSFASGLAEGLMGGAADKAQQIAEDRIAQIEASLKGIDIPELPEIPERQKTTLEMELEAEQADNAMSYMMDFVDRLNERMQSMKMSVDGPDMSQIQSLLDNVQADLQVNVGAITDQATKGLKESLEGMKSPSAKPELQATESRLLTRGAVDNIAQQQLDVQKQQEQRLRQLEQNMQISNTFLERIADKELGNGLRVELV